MSDTPLSDAIKQIPANELRIEGTASQSEKEAHITLEREKGGVSGGLVGGISDTKGWSVGGFFRWVWGK